MIKAVIFDMDGVLVDAKEWHYEALNRALGLFGMEISRADHLTTYDGLPTRKKLEMLTASEGLPRDLHDFINRLKQIYTMEAIGVRCKPTFIHEQALSSLKSRGYRLGLASNSVRRTVSAMMQLTYLDQYMDVTLCNEDVTSAKPAPEIYLKAMERLGASPAETLILEDNEHGVQAARDSGAHVMVVRSVREVNLANILARIEQVREDAG
jgi:HAD superfamily hydrolase (TIGR01509 family)